MEIYELENERVNLESALAAMTDRADAESLRAERAEETALKLAPLVRDYDTLLKDHERMTAERDVLEAALKTTAEERDNWKRRRAELARATAHSLAAKLEAVEHGNKVLTASRNDWMDKAIQKGKEWQALQAKLEAVEAIVAQAITDPYLIAHLEAALATTGPSLRECPRCKRVETMLEKWRAEWDRGWDRSTELCIEEIEAALALEDRPV